MARSLTVRPIGAPPTRLNPLRAPRASVSLDLGGHTRTGLGYVERLGLSIPPWSLPFDRLLWRRFISDRPSVIWIEWTGTTRRRWVWMDPSSHWAAACLGPGYSLVPLLAAYATAAPWI